MKAKQKFMDEWIKRKTGVPLNTKCFRCNKTNQESFALGPFPTGINHPEYYQTYSFYRYGENKHACPRCHKEMELESLFKLMDARDARKPLKTRS